MASATAIIGAIVPTVKTERTTVEPRYDPITGKPSPTVVRRTAYILLGRELTETEYDRWQDGYWDEDEDADGDGRRLCSMYGQDVLGIYLGYAGDEDRAPASWNLAQVNAAVAAAKKLLAEYGVTTEPRLFLSAEY